MIPAMVSSPTPQRTGRSSGSVLALTAAAQFVLQLDFSIVNVALPTVQHELHFSAAGLQWVITGYALTYGALLLVAGRIGDMIGHRRALLAGLALFAVASLAGGVAVSPAMLVAGRLVQGAGAALVAPAALALLTVSYPAPAARARALGIFQGSTAAGATAGIVAGGILTEYLGWRSVLLINPPVIAVLMLLVVRRLPAPRPPRERGPVDVAGAVLMTASVAALIYGLATAQEHGFGDRRAITLLSVAVLLAGAVLLAERRARAPMLPATLFANRARSVALTVAFLLGGVVAGYVYFISLYLQHVVGLSAVLTGLALVPATATNMATSALLTRRVVARVGTMPTLLIGLVILGAGQLAFSQIAPAGGYVPQVLIGLLCTSFGMALAYPTISYVVTSDVPTALGGIAGGSLVTAQQVGAAVGLAALATIAAARTGSSGSVTDGYRLSYLVAAGIVGVGVVIVAALDRRAREA
jgi:EmrB/QacA subfamily drug resistance transporter